MIDLALNVLFGEFENTEREKFRVERKMCTCVSVDDAVSWPIGWLSPKLLSSRQNLVDGPW